MKILLNIALFLSVALGHAEDIEPANTEKEKLNHVLASVPLPDLDYDLVFPFKIIRQSTKWNPLSGKPCPLSMEKAIELVAKDVKAKLGAKVEGPVRLTDTVSVTLSYLPYEVSDNGDMRLGRYCYKIDFGVVNLDYPGFPRDMVSHDRVSGAILLDGHLADFVFKSKKESRQEKVKLLNIKNDHLLRLKKENKLIGKLVSELEELIGPPTSSESNMIVYRFDAGSYGMEWFIVHENGRIIAAIKRGIEYKTKY